MSVPEKPYTRKEAYLNAAATGDTSGIPETPYTREEMYLDAIAKNGGGGGGGGSSSLSGLTDVDISNPTDGQTLVYDAASQKWVNGESAGGGVLVAHEAFNEQLGYYALDKTAGEIEAAMKSSAIVFVVGNEGENGQEHCYAQQITIMQKDGTAEFVYTFITILTTYDADGDMWGIEPVSYRAATANDYPFGD